MPTKRARVSRGLAVERITQDAIDAWKSGDYWRLHAAIGCLLFQMPDWACDPPGTDDRPASLRTAYPAPDVVAVKAALIEIAGPPPRRWRFD